MYSIPTLSNDVINLAGIDCVTDPQTKDNEKIFIHPDNWRQIEFVSKENLATINNEIKNINNIYLDQKINNSSGYKNIYLRTLSDPLSHVGLKLNNLLSFFNTSNRKYLAFPEDSNIVRNGFFICLENCGIYGIYDKNEIIKSLSLLINSKPNKDEISSLINYGNAHNLIIVDWIRMTIIDEKF